ncbi:MULTISPECIES: chemotaxis protein CheW [Shewanella]|uniref:Chemotaxis protein CheW n=1 Tax=Shewanella bicestrii TaxID=2018305 RepID=A0A220UNW7_9GAMM|nr:MULTISPECIES: chemotaxis protein CheW [Shewanella]ABK47600.1 CheW protein [Shewanella sp. ANA-3]ASK69888.1 chemotaxis protein CheW [Shewanella bicestrii]MDH1469667.1 chemotaxis protein CheW [Shewanella sp. GD03713]
MSKSVDETVFDFFELLLHEEDCKAVDSPSAPQHEVVAPLVGKKNEAQLLDDAILAEHSQAKVHASVTIAAEVQPQKAKSVSNMPHLDEPAPLVNKQALEKLLAPVLKTVVIEDKPAEVLSEVAPEMDKVPEEIQESISSLPECDASVTIEQPSTVVDDEIIIETTPETQVGFAPPSITKDLQEVLDDEFQVLFFKVAGLTLAVPLVSLGGIVKVERINHIIGRPSWFLGVQTHREEQLNLVDTCAWVMPEKYTDKLAQSVNYQYLVLLEGSNWGLACESLVNAVKINKSQVNWRSKAGKRPWLAGVVKEQMCGILHVQALVEMLDAGLGCQDSIG